MSLKFVSNLLTALAGGFLVVASQTFSHGTASWLALGIGLFAAVVGAAGISAGRFELRDIGYAYTAVLGVWTVVSSQVFSGSALGWLIFADAVALVAVSVASLAAHEVSTERVVHTLVIEPARERELV